MFAAMRADPDDVVARARAACGDVDPAGVRVVNLHGPLGAGKTHALDRLVASGTVLDLVIDGVDGDRAVDAARGRIERLGPGSVAVVAGRRPLTAAESRIRVHAIAVPRWTPDAVRALVTAYGTDADTTELVVSLADGVPLVADRIARMLGAGTPPDAVGALADAAAREVVRRLASEDPDPPAAPLYAAAVAGPVDEELLAAVAGPEPGSFDRLGALSIVVPHPTGLAVAEPYRTLFDLGYAWRHPIRHRALRARGNLHRYARIEAADDRSRAALTDDVLCVSTDPEVRHTFFPVPRPPVAHRVRIRPAGPADGDAVDRAMSEWARHEGLDRRCVSRLLDLWVAQPVPGFDLLVDEDDRVRGMVNLTAIGDGTRPALDRLLQQHAEPLIAPEADGYPDRTGTVIGMMITEGDDQALRAMLLRHIVRTGVMHRRLIVSTSWGPYQQLANRIGLPRVGATRTDAYRCGRTSDIFAQTFTAGALAAWLPSLNPAPADVPAAAPVRVSDIRAALRDIRDTGRLAANPLLAGTTLGSAPELAAFLREEIAALAASGSAVDADAGRALTAYYLLRTAGHDGAAHRLHLSRATYFRRLDHGLTALANAARALTVASPPAPAAGP
jgi:hypothetical protein